MAGRPRKPAALKALHGDTRKVGALRHAEEIAVAFIAPRGTPPMPAAFAEQNLGKDATDEQIVAEIRRARARAFFAEMCSQLASIGLLAACDGAILEGMAMNRALRQEAFEAGNVKEFDALDRGLQTASNLTGLNESARAKIPKPASQQMSEMDQALAAGLDDAVVQ